MYCRYIIALGYYTTGYMLQVDTAWILYNKVCTAGGYCLDYVQGMYCRWMLLGYYTTRYVLQVDTPWILDSKVRTASNRDGMAACTCALAFSHSFVVFFLQGCWCSHHF